MIKLFQPQLLQIMSVILHLTYLVVPYWKACKEYFLIFSYNRLNKVSMATWKAQISLSNQMDEIPSCLKFFIIMTKFILDSIFQATSINFTCTAKVEPDSMHQRLVSVDLSFYKCNFAYVKSFLIIVVTNNVTYTTSTQACSTLLESLYEILFENIFLQNQYSCRGNLEAKI